jgi:hypothetical protein
MFTYSYGQTSDYLCKLERSRFEVYSSWAVGNHEAEINMNDMSLSIKKNISIVSILNLQDVAHEGVTDETREEIVLGYLEIILENVGENLVQRHVRVLLLQRVDRNCIRDELLG